MKTKENIYLLMDNYNDHVNAILKEKPIQFPLDSVECNEIVLADFMSLYQARGWSPQETADKWYDREFSRERTRLRDLLKKDMLKSKQAFLLKLEYIKTTKCQLPSKLFTREQVIDVFNDVLTPNW